MSFFSLGGIIPPFAQSMHRKNIERVVNEAVSNAKVDVNDIDAIACTITPGTINTDKYFTS